MSAITSKTGPSRQLDLQIKQGKAVLRKLKETLEDLDDRLELAKAKAENGGKPLIPWEIVAKELDIRPPPKKRPRKLLRA
jgi:hypothetical protein